MKPTVRLRAFLLLTSSSLLAASHASAQSNWLNTASGTQQWNTATNWSTNPTVPSGQSVTANLSVDLGAAQTVNLATPVTLGSLTFGDSTTAFNAQNIQGSALIFDNNGSGATLTQAGASTIANTISNSIVLNDNLTIVNNGTNPDRGSAINLNGVISGTGGIRINAGGGAAVYFNTSGGNTYSGGFTLNGANAKVVTYQNGDSFGTGTFTVTSNGGIVDTSAPGGAALLLTTSNAAVWNGNFTTGIWNSNGNVTLGNNITLTRGSHFGVGGNISESVAGRSLTLNSNASSIFNGTNTYTGGTTVSGGSLAFLKTASMPSTGNVSFANGTTLGIGLGGDGWTSTGTGAGTLAGIFDGTNVGVGPGSSTFSYGTSSGVGLNLIVTGNHSFGAIENLRDGQATAFTKSGIGTLTITGDNTYTGATTVQGGGALILDYDSSATSKFASGQSLTLGGGGNTSTGMLGGGTITIKGGTAFTEIVSATSLNAGHTTLARDGGTSLLRMNAITRAAGGTISFADGAIAQTDTNNFGTSGANGVIGGWATVGNNWAVSANTGAADTAITALASYTPFVNNVGSATTNYLLSGTDSLAGATAVGTLKIDAASGSLTLGNNNLTVTSTSATALGGIMYAGGAGGTYTITPGIGGTGRIAASTAGSEFIFAVQSGTLTVDAILGSSGNSPVTKTGTGTLVLGGTNTTNGFYYVNEGVLRLNNAAATGAAGNFGGLSTFVQNGAALELTGGFSFTNQERLMISGSGIANGGALRSISGTNTWRGFIEVAIGGARINNDSTGLLTLNNGIMTIAGGDITFGGTGDTTVTSVTNDFRWGSTAIKGGGGLIKDGAGKLTLSGSNNYVGATTVSAGTLYVTGALTHSPVSVEANGTLGSNGAAGTLGNGLVIVAGGNLDLTGAILGANSTGILSITGGNLALGNLTFQDLIGWDWANAAEGTYELIDGSFTVNFGNTAYISPATAYNFGNGKGGYFTSGSLNAVIVAIPEPSAALLGCIGGLFLLRRRR